MTVGSTPKFKRQLTPALLVSLILWLTVASEDTALGAAALGKTQWGNRLQPALTYLYLPRLRTPGNNMRFLCLRPTAPSGRLIPTLTYRSVGSYANATMCVAFDSVNPHPTWCSIFTSYDPARTDLALLWTTCFPQQPTTGVSRRSSTCRPRIGSGRKNGRSGPRRPAVSSFPRPTWCLRPMVVPSP